MKCSANFNLKNQCYELWMEIIGKISHFIGISKGWSETYHALINIENDEKEGWS